MTQSTSGVTWVLLGRWQTREYDGYLYSGPGVFPMDSNTIVMDRPATICEKLAANWKKASRVKITAK